MLLTRIHQNVDPKLHELLVLLLMDSESIVQSCLAMQHETGSVMRSCASRSCAVAKPYQIRLVDGSCESA